MKPGTRNNNNINSVGAERSFNNRVMIVDTNVLSVDRYAIKTEITYKIVDFRTCTRIKSFVYTASRTGADSNNVHEWFSRFFASVPVIITIGTHNKHFIGQYAYNVYDLFTDDIGDVVFPRRLHTRRYPLTPHMVYSWNNPSKCPASTCRYSHTGNCSFKNVQCMIEWLNDPIF